ncbi:MAG: YceH family protein [Hydrogenophaga sp.]
MTPDTPIPSATPRPRGHDFAVRPLSTAEARVLGTLMEKARTVPDSYPLTLNALVTGCNQKSSREPVMQLSDDQVLEALDGLRSIHMVLEGSGSRVARFEHNFLRATAVPEQSAVLLGMLMLRGPQTAGELRLNTERWYRFLDIASVDAFLEELQDRSPERGGPLVVKLPRAPGAREQRWAHLLCGPVDTTALFTPSAPGPSAGPQEEDWTALKRRVDDLENTVTALQAQLQNLHDQLGLSQPGQP